MTCEELRAHDEAIALGVAGPEETAELQAHLARQCENCTPAFRQALTLVTGLSTLAAEAAPSPALRRRIVASVQPERKAAVPLWWALPLAASLALAGYFGWRSWQLQEDVRLARQELRASLQLEASTQQALSVLTDPGTKQVTFGGAEPLPPQGRVFVNPQRGVLLIAERLPQIAPDKTFEFWLVPAQGAPVPAGTFLANNNGRAVHYRPGAVDLSGVAAVAVSLEDKPGVQVPTKILFVAKL